MSQTFAFKKSVYLLIARNLFFSAFLVGALFSIGSYFHSRQMLFDAVVHLSTAQMTFIKGRFYEYLEGHPNADMGLVLQSAINYPPSTELNIKEGEFVYFALHDEHLETIAVHLHEGLQNKPTIVDFALERIKDTTTADSSGSMYAHVVIGGKNYLEIHDTLLKHKDNAISIYALFALSDLADQSIRSFTIKNTFFVMFLVLGTTMFLYPVVTALFTRIAMYSCRLLTAHIQTMQALGVAIAKRDIDTSYHNYRVALYSVEIAEYIGFPRDRMQSLIKGSFLHDIGKIGVEDSVLHSSERYSVVQRSIMQTHVEQGIDIISRSEWLRDALDIVAHHHEKYDGSGYPAQLEGNEISKEARIFAVADVFDALTSRRPYKDPLGYNDAIKIMKEDFKGHFDPQILKLFLNISEELYNKYAGVENELLTEDFNKVIIKYFHCDCDRWATWKYLGRC